MRSIKYKIIISFCLAAMLIKITLGSVISLHLNASIGKQSQMLSEDLLDITNSSLERYHKVFEHLVHGIMEDLEHIAMDITRHPGLIVNLERYQVNVLTGILDDFRDKTAQMDFVLLFDLKGNHLASSPSDINDNADVAWLNTFYQSWDLGKRARRKLEKGPEEQLSAITIHEPAFIEALKLTDRNFSGERFISFASAKVVVNDFKDPVAVLITGKILNNYQNPLKGFYEMTGLGSAVYAGTIPIVHAGFQDKEGGGVTKNLQLSPQIVKQVYASEAFTHFSVPLAGTGYLITCSALNSSAREKIGILCVAIPEQEIMTIIQNMLSHGTEVKDDLQMWLLVIGVISMALFTGVSLMIAIGITRPLSAVVTLMEKLNTGDLSARLKSRTDEIGSMIEAINGFANNLQQAMTKQKRDEEELRQLRNYLFNIVNSMPSVLVAVDQECRVTQWNNHTEDTTGLSFEKARAQPLAAVFPLLAGKMEQIRTSIRERRVIRSPKVSRKLAQETRLEDITIFPLVANGVEGAVIRVDDVTEQVRMEEMIIQSEKMLSVGGLAAGMAHEISNPLAGMLQTANVMKSRLGDLDMTANLQVAESIGVPMDKIKAFMDQRGIPRMVDAINESGQRVAEIVDNMLSFARKSEAIVSTYDPVQLMDKTLELAATDYDFKKKYDFKAIKIVKEYEENLPMISCEGGKIQQVLLNILRNGAQAMQSQNRGEDYIHSFVLRLMKEENWLRIEIQDNGPGMDKAIQARIFEPFFTTKPVGVGTGLGLSVSYFIITQNHGGTMEVVSESGNGATFIIRLPLS